MNPLSPVVVMSKMLRVALWWLLAYWIFKLFFGRSKKAQAKDEYYAKMENARRNEYALRQQEIYK